MKAKKYRLKLPPKEAMQWTGKNGNAINRFIGAGQPGPSETTRWGIYTSDGPVDVNVGDWIIKYSDSNFHAYASDIFADLYEEVPK